MDARYLTDIRNSRPEVATKNLPNITMTKSTINLLEPVKKYYMFHFGSVSYKDNVGYISSIEVKNLKVNGGKVQLKICNKDFPHEKKIKFPLYNQVIGL